MDFRNRKSHRIVPSASNTSNSNTVDIIGLRFSVRGTKVNWTEFVDLGDIPHEFARALYELANEESYAAATIKTFSNTGFRKFAAFLRQRRIDCNPVDSIADIDYKVIDSYVTWLFNYKSFGYGQKPNTYRPIKQLLEQIQTAHPERCHPKLSFPYNPFPGAKAKRKHRKALSSAQFADLKSAVIGDMGVLQKRFEHPQKYAPTMQGHPEPGWGAKGTKEWLVWYFDNILGGIPKTYTQLMAEGHKRFYGNVGRAFNNDKEREETEQLGGSLNRFYAELGVFARLFPLDLVPYLLLFCARTAINTTPLCQIRYQCIKKHPTRDDLKIIEWWKGRGGRWIKQDHPDRDAYGRDDYPVDIIHRLRAITDPLREFAKDEDKPYLLLVGVAQAGGVRRLSSDELNNSIKTWARLKDLDFVPQPGNIRPAAGSSVFKMTKGDLEQVRRFLGKLSLDDTSNYVRVGFHPEFTKERHHAGMILEEDTLGRSEGDAIDAVKEALDVPREQAAQIVSGDMDTLMGRCKKVNDSPIPGQEKGKPCKAAWACLVCSSHVIFPDDLWKIYSFYLYIKVKQETMPHEEFAQFYAPFFRIVDEDISPKFSQATRDAAWDRAKSDPFPAWDTALIPVPQEDLNAAAEKLNTAE